MVDKRRRLKSMKVKNYGEFRPFESSSLYLHFHPFVSSQGYFANLQGRGFKGDMVTVQKWEMGVSRVNGLRVWGRIMSLGGYLFFE